MNHMRVDSHKLSIVKQQTPLFVRDLFNTFLFYVPINMKKKKIDLKRKIEKDNQTEITSVTQRHKKQY